MELLRPPHLDRLCVVHVFRKIVNVVCWYPPHMGTGTAAGTGARGLLNHATIAIGSNESVIHVVNVEKYLGESSMYMTSAECFLLCVDDLRNQGMEHSQSDKRNSTIVSYRNAVTYLFIVEGPVEALSGESESESPKSVESVSESPKSESPESDESGSGLPKSGLSVPTLIQSDRQLLGHSHRVIDMAWSPYREGLLASASFDNTAQVRKKDITVEICVS